MKLAPALKFFSGRLFKPAGTAVLFLGGMRQLATARCVRVRVIRAAYIGLGHAQQKLGKSADAARAMRRI